ncbi:MAG: radical SAM protein [Peptococcaceae bacterium]|nr:radical SAM protein [Peptococcaceae bacterium]
MEWVLHLTNACNLSCEYCVQPKGLHGARNSMTPETAQKAMDLILSDPANAVGIGFYGGEPLLCRDLMMDTIAYSQSKNIGGKRVHFKLTTNGTLLDEAFLDSAKREGILISISLDGHQEAHDRNRKTHKGQGSFETLRPILPKLLRQNPYTVAMMTVAPNTASLLYESVAEIYSLGFMNIVCNTDYLAQWQERDLAELKHQYTKIADLYYEMTTSEKKFFFSPFDSKIDSHINHREYCRERCKLGYEQISVAMDGTLYPCLQFVDIPEYQIGNVTQGIDSERRKEIYALSLKRQPECRSCAFKDRCRHTCSCINQTTTGRLDTPSPILCAMERMLIPIADKVATKLFRKKDGMFIQKHYNELYPLISLMEDVKTRKGVN